MSLEPGAIDAASPRLRPRSVAVGSRPGTVRILKFGGSSVATPDRIVRIFVPWEQIEKVRCDREGEFVATEQDAAALLVAKIDILLELRERRNATL